MLKQFKVQMTSLGTIHLSNYISIIRQEQMQFLSSFLFFSRGQKIFRIPWTNTVQFKGSSENSIQTSTSILNSHFSSCLYMCKEKILNFYNFNSFIKAGFLVCNNFHLIPPLLKIIINSKNDLLFFDKLESIESLRVNDTFQGFCIRGVYRVKGKFLVY